MKVIGPNHRTRELAGWHRVTMGNGSSWATGTEIAAQSRMITAGIICEAVTFDTRTEINSPVAVVDGTPHA
ncbi:MAG: hypothetical protein ABSA57_06250 [Candidatus Acidiferrales bacterium]